MAAPVLPPLQSIRAWSKAPSANGRLPMPSPQTGATIIAPTKDALARELWEAPKEVREAAVDGYKPVAEDVLATFTISSDDVDRHGDTVVQQGADLTNYRRNPVVLFGHASWMPPVARAVATYVARGVMKSTALYTPEGTYEFGATVGKLVKGDFLPGTSIGFKPRTWTVNEERDTGDSWFAPVDFTEWELLEWSNVPIPANPNALQDGKQLELLGIGAHDAGLFVDWAEKQLDGEASLLIPKEQLEQMLPPWRTLSRRRQARAADTEPVVAPPPAPPPTQVPVVDPGETTAVEGDPVVEDPAETMTCPECGYTGPEAEFEATPPDGAMRDIASERLVRELRRRGLLVALVPAPADVGRSGAPVTSSAPPNHDRSTAPVQRASLTDAEVSALVPRLVREALEDALTEHTGRLPR